MIFDNDYTSLNGGASAIPMAEGYNCSYGAALALVESARNDFAMFNAMMGIEARSSAIMREFTSVVQEGEIQALAESAVGGIWKKIKELFTKLIAKIKAILHNFMSKINGLVMSNKNLAKKYEKELLRKTNIGNLEVKWRKPKSSLPDYDVNKYNDSDGWKEDASDRHNYFTIACDFDDVSIDDYLEDEETVEIKEIGGIRKIINDMKECDKLFKEFERENKKTINEINEKVKNANKKANSVAKDAATKDDNGNYKASDDDVKSANKAYDMAVALQDVVFKIINLNVEYAKLMIKYTKAAFMKAVAANNKKLEENALYLDYVAEAAADEVEDVIQGAIDSNAEYTDIMSSSNASSNVLDANVSDDPDYNVADYAKGSKKAAVEKYKKDSVDGTIGADYDGKESAFFGELLY